LLKYSREMSFVCPLLRKERLCVSSDVIWPSVSN